MGYNAANMSTSSWGCTWLLLWEHVLVEKARESLRLPAEDTLSYSSNGEQEE
jgi:hypothetical protein